MDGVSSKLVNAGALGILALVLLYGIIALWRAREKDRVKHDDAMEELRKEMRDKDAQHRKDVETMMATHIDKAESWVEKGLAMANNMEAVLASITRRKS